MSRARRKWEQDLIATAALMGTVFEEVSVNRRKFLPDGTVYEETKTSWAVNLRGDEDSREVFSNVHQAAYWFIVERHRLSFQNNGELIPCTSYSGMMHTDASIRRHQSYTKEAEWRKEQKLSSKFRRNFGHGLTVKQPSPTDT